jgi:hypothetical protein
MLAATPQSGAWQDRAAAPPAAWYTILGETVAVVSDDADTLDRVAETYGAFRAASGAPNDALVIELRCEADTGTYAVRDSSGYERHWPTASSASIDVLSRIVHGVLARLQRRGIYAIHAGALSYRDAALIVAGKSGQGKTTLVLGLLRRGMGLLSDEFAIVEPDAQRILPYRRSLHVRPGTPELIPELAFLHERPRHQLGGGIEWSVTPDDLARVFPYCLAAPAPLRSVLLLDGTPRAGEAPAVVPVPAGVAAMELLRGTWAASVDFAGGLARIGTLMNGVACARLRTGDLDATADCVMGWLEERHG